MTTPSYLGETFTDANPLGELRVDVTGADDGSWYWRSYARCEQSGRRCVHRHDVADDVTEMRVHAADDATYIKIVYTATETIENGALRFTAPAGWSKPQGSDPGEEGFTSCPRNR